MEKAPTQKQLDEMRATGYRPTVVACCVNDNKVLMLFKKDYRLWMMPQSGLGADQDAEEVAFDVIKEEIGKEFLSKCGKKLTYIGDDQVEFLPEKQTNEEITTSDGKSFKMLGKHYYFYMVPVKTDSINLAETSFYDEFYWFESKPGMILASKIYQPGKRRITMKAITLLQEKGHIA